MNEYDVEARSNRAFQDDRAFLQSINIRWEAADLLSQEGIFWLDDIAKLLKLDRADIQDRAQELVERGNPTWETLGVREIWNRWIVRMKVFAPYYREHLAVGAERAEV